MLKMMWEKVHGSLRGLFGELSLGSPPHYAFRNEISKTMSNTASKSQLLAVFAYPFGFSLTKILGSFSAFFKLLLVLRK